MPLKSTLATLAVLALAPLPSSLAAPHNGTRTAGPSQLSLTAQLQLVDLASDRFALLPSDSDFVFDFNQEQENPGRGGQLVVANRKTFPALVGTGAAMAVGRVGPCGLNTFHVHPRSAELQIVTSSRLITETIPEDNVLDPPPPTPDSPDSPDSPNNNPPSRNRRVIRAELGPYAMTPFPQGSVHAQYNPDCAPAVFVAAFAHEDPGAGHVADEVFAASDEVVAAALGQGVAGEDVGRLRAAIPDSIALGVRECLDRCGIHQEKRGAV